MLLATLLMFLGIFVDLPLTKHISSKSVHIMLEHTYNKMGMIYDNSWATTSTYILRMLSSTYR